MNHSKTVAAWITVALLALAAASARATMIWGSPTHIGLSGGDGVGDISTAGTLMYAYNMGNRTTGSFDLNGVTFQNSGWSARGITTTYGSTPGMNDTNPDWGAGTFVYNATPYNTLSANYRLMLGDASALNNPTLNGGTVADSFTLALGGLTLSHIYQFQWWVNDSRGVSRTVTATDGTAVTLEEGFPLATQGATGQYAIGTFTATSGSESIVFVGDTIAADMINGYQLRDLTVPEPATIMLLGIGAGILCLRRRKTA